MQRLCAALERLVIVPRLLALDTGRVYATAPMLRGVWGAALHDLDPRAYAAVFTGIGPQHARTPRYIIRPSLAMEFAPALEWIGLGEEALRFDLSLMRAWDIASGMGLGAERDRFHIRRIVPLGPGGPTQADGYLPRPWRMSRVQWPLAGDPATTPCRLNFVTPLRLVREGKLLENPTFLDIVSAAAKRATALVAMDESPANSHLLRDDLREMSTAVRALPWQGRRCDLYRYSGRQKRELEFHGVVGSVDLPEGPGPAWPLLAAAQWLHIGKTTVVGLGQLVVEPLQS